MPHLEPERRIESIQVRNRIREIEGTIYSGRRPIGGVEACVTGPGQGPGTVPAKGWAPFDVHQRWGGFDQTTWFRFRVVTPADMRGKPLVAFVRPGGESLAYVNGKPFHGVDRWHDELVLSEKARPGQAFDIVLESVPSVRFDEYHHFAYADLAVMQPDVWDFYWDCQVAYEVWETLEEGSAVRLRLMELLNAVVKSVDLQHAGTERYHASIKAAARALKRGLSAFPSEPGMGRLTLAGHTHIDTAWLWPLRETRRKCGRTYSSMTNLLERYPEFRFSCSQPVQYDWLERDYPDVFRRIKGFVKEGRWEPCGGMWVESDCNVPCGESLVRQFLFGNRYFRRKFGVHSPIAWLPDAFGYTWSLPQILKKAQIEAFVTSKLSWGQFTKFPYSFFQWEGADGTRIPALLPPLNYNGDPTPENCITQWKEFKQKDKADELPFSIGWGDGGGGTTMNMIEHGKRLGNITGIPKCAFGSITESVRRMLAGCDTATLPVWNDELYLELHRGCQTTQARAKRDNRKCEVLLHDTELLAAMASLHGAKYDRKKLEAAWKIVLTNQFHDILPGSSITEVYTQTALDYAEARNLAGSVRDEALRFLASRLDTPGAGIPVLIVNTCSWVRDGIAEVQTGLPRGGFHVVDPVGEVVAHQRVGKDRVLIRVEGLPPLGYAVYRILPGRKALAAEDAPKAAVNRLENAFLRVRLDNEGCISSIFDKLERREVLPKGARANVLQLFDDRPFAHDAWDIDFNVEEVALPRPQAESIEVIEEGPLRSIVRVVSTTERSSIIQDITLCAGSSRLDFVTHVDWHEKRALLRVAFPVAVRSRKAAFEIQYATIERATHRNTEFDAGRHEVAAQRWADVSEGDYGVTLLNDCKYGYDVRDNVLRLSLLRSTVEPDPHADQGEHDFTYALYPHGDDWRNGAVQEGAELNMPLLAVPVKASKGALPGVYALAAVDADNVVIDAVKKAEDSDALIVRVYEAYGQRGEVTLTFGQALKSIAECDLMEENDVPLKPRGASVSFFVTPYELRTFKVAF